MVEWKKSRRMNALNCILSGYLSVRRKASKLTVSRFIELLGGGLVASLVECALWKAAMGEIGEQSCGQGCQKEAKDWFS